MSEITAGSHLGKITDYAITVSQKGDPMCAVRFKTEEGTLYWNGTIRETEQGKRNFSLETLIILGLKSIEDIEKLVDGPSSGVLDMKKDFELQVELSEFNGKLRPQIKFINEVGGSAKFKNKMEKSDFKIKLAGMKNLRGEFSSAYQASKGVSPGAQSLEEVPF